MTVRSFTQDENYPSPSKKAQRLPATKLEDLKGFEFLEEVTKLSEEQTRVLDSSKITFILDRLDTLLVSPGTSLPALAVACRVIAASDPLVGKKEKKKICKTMASGVNAERAALLSPFVNHLFLSGNPLFEKFSELPAQNYANLYSAIMKKDAAAVQALLNEPLDLSVKQDSYYVLFDMACLKMPYPIIMAFLLKNPYITSNAYIHLILNKKLSSDERLSVCVELALRGVNPDIPDDTRWTPMVYAIVHHEFNVFKFLCTRVDLKKKIDNLSYLERAIEAKFTESALILVQIEKPTRDLYNRAIELRLLKIAAAIAKELKIKWDNIPDYKAESDEIDPSIRESAKKVINKANHVIYREVCVNPEIFSMETLTSIKEDHLLHYKIFTKTISHAWGIQIEADHPVTGAPIESTGNSPYISLSSWIAFLKKMEEIPEASALLEEFKHVFHHKMSNDEYNKVKERLRKNLRVICLSGYSTHTTYSSFKSPIILYANRGSQAEVPGVSVYLDESILPELEQTIKRCVFDKVFDKSKNYSEDKLVIDLDLENVFTLGQAGQSGPFCTLASLKALSFGILVSDCVDDSYDHTLDVDWEEAENEMKDTYKTLSTEYRIEILWGALRETELFLKESKPSPKHALFYYQNLLAILVKLESSLRWSQAEKIEHGNQIKAYLNRLMDLL